MSILGLDIGTTGVKAVAFRNDGALVHSAYREYDLKSPAPGHLELDPGDVLARIREVLGEVAQSTRDDPARSLATSTLGEAAVPVDEKNRPVGNAIVGFDSRGIEDAAALSSKMSNDEVYAITGHEINSSHTLFKILWRRKHEPEVFRRARRYLCFGDFVMSSLGLEPRINYPVAARTLAFDVHRLEWSERMLDEVGLDHEAFARPAAPEEPVGEIGQNDLGLPGNCVVAGGLHDQPAGIVGAGVERGESLMATGTVICLGVLLDRVPAARVMVPNNLCCYPTFGKSRYVSLAYNFTGGSLLKWYRDNLSSDEVARAEERGVSPYAIMCEGLGDKPGDLLVLPHFTTTGTPWLDPRTVGAIFGLRLTTTRKEIIKALLEAVIYEIRLNAEILAEAGVDIHVYRAAGGAARSDVWMQIAADILDRPVAKLAMTQAASLGAALVGARAAGILRTDDELREIARRVSREEKMLEPRRPQADAYRESFEIYRDLYPATKDISHRISALADARSRN